MGAAIAMFALRDSTIRDTYSVQTPPHGLGESKGGRAETEASTDLDSTQLPNQMPSDATTASVMPDLSQQWKKLRSWDNMTEELLRATSSHGNGAIPLLTTYMTDATPRDAAEAAASCLAMIGTPESLGALVNGLVGCDNENTKDAISRGLQRLNQRDGLPLLIESVDRTRDWFLFSGARSAVSRLASDTEVNLMAQKIASPEATTQQKEMMAQLLSEVRNRDAVPALTELIPSSEDVLLRRSIANALGNTGGADAALLLAQCIETWGITNAHDVTVVTLAASSTQGSLATLSDLFENSTNGMVRYGAAMALTQVDPRAREYLLDKPPRAESPQ